MRTLNKILLYSTMLYSACTSSIEQTIPQNFEPIVQKQEVVYTHTIGDLLDTCLPRHGISPKQEEAYNTFMEKKLTMAKERKIPFIMYVSDWQRYGPTKNLFNMANRLSPKDAALMHVDIDLSKRGIPDSELPLILYFASNGKLKFKSYGFLHETFFKYVESARTGEPAVFESKEMPPHSPCGAW